MKYLFSLSLNSFNPSHQSRFIFAGGENPGGDWKYYDNGKLQKENLGSKLEQKYYKKDKIQDFKDLRQRIQNEFDERVKDKDALWNKTSKLIADSILGRNNTVPTLEKKGHYLSANAEFQYYITSLETKIRSIVINEDADQKDQMDLKSIQTHLKNNAEQKERVYQSKDTIDRTIQIQDLRTKLFNAYKWQGINQKQADNLWNKISNLIQKSILEGVGGAKKNFDIDSQGGLDDNEFKEYLKIIDANVQSILKLKTNNDGKTVIDKYNENDQKIAQDILMASSNFKLTNQITKLMESEKVSLDEIKERLSIIGKLRNTVSKIPENYKFRESRNVEIAENALLSPFLSKYSLEQEIKTYFEQLDSPNSVNMIRMTGIYGVDKISLRQYIARLTNDTEQVVNILFSKENLEKNQDIKTNQQNKEIERISTFISSFEETNPDKEYKEKLLEARIYLKRGESQNAIRILNSISEIGKSKYINLNAASKDDRVLAHALRKGLGDTNKAGEIMIQNVFKTNQETIQQAIEEGKSEEEIQKIIVSGSKEMTKNTNDTEKEAIETVIKKVEEQIPRVRFEAEEQYIKIIKSLQSQGLNMDLISKLGENKDIVIEAIQTQLALKNSLRLYIIKNGENNLPNILQEYSDMKGFGGIFDFSDENAKLATEIAIAIGTTILLAGFGAAAATARLAMLAVKLSKAFPKIANAGLKIKNGINVIKNSGKASKNVVEVVDHATKFTITQQVGRGIEGKGLSYIDNDLKFNLGFYGISMVGGKFLGAAFNKLASVMKNERYPEKAILEGLAKLVKPEHAHLHRETKGMNAYMKNIGESLGVGANITGEKVITKNTIYGKTKTEMEINSNIKLDLELQSTLEEAQKIILEIFTHLEKKFKTKGISTKQNDDITILIEEIINQNPDIKKEFPNITRYINQKTINKTQQPTSNDFTNIDANRNTNINQDLNKVKEYKDQLETKNNK